MRRSIALLIIMDLLFTAAMLGSTGCGKKHYTPEERSTLDRIRPMIGWAEDFNVSFQRYPGDWDELMKWKGQDMPINPYTNQPMVALGSRDFDPQKSPGNFFYARVIRDDQVINFQLYVFGKNGLLARYSHSPMAAN